MNWVFLFASFILVALGQPAWIPEAGLLTAVVGYALFWKAMLQIQKRLLRFLAAALWFIGVQAVQLSWMTSTHYMGPLILGVYAGLLLGLGLQFGLLSSFIDPKKPLSPFQCFALAGGWVLLEWMRLFLLTGFTWNPAGLSMAGARFPLQLSAVIGIYGLSFWVMWTNLAALAFFQRPDQKRVIIWLYLALFPYGFGYVYEAWANSYGPPEKNLTAAVVDTGLMVEEKNRDRDNPLAFIPAIDQWEQVWSYIKKDTPVDLIVLPEAAFPFGADQPVCSLELLRARWLLHFGEEGAADFPPLQPPYAHVILWKGKVQWVATNAFFAQALANHFHADVITGLDYDDGKARRTNSAFHFRPKGQDPQRYDKQILAPIGEYVPFQNLKWVARFLAREFGIVHSFDAGKEGKVFQAKVALAPAICLEETHTEIIRGLRNQGANLLVSLSNDVWFPGTRLARQHFDHARVRAVENGIYILRSCNMGWTSGIDCFGQPIKEQSPGTKGALYLTIPIVSYPTLYSLWGDLPLVLISALAMLFFLLFRIRDEALVVTKKLPRNGSLG